MISGSAAGNDAHGEAFQACMRRFAKPSAQGNATSSWSSHAQRKEVPVKIIALRSLWREYPVRN